MAENTNRVAQNSAPQTQPKVDQPQPQPQPQAAKLEELSEARRAALAQHYAGTPPEKRAGLVATFRQYAPPAEKEFMEKISNSRN